MKHLRRILAIALVLASVFLSACAAEKTEDYVIDAKLLTLPPLK